MEKEKQCIMGMRGAGTFHHKSFLLLGCVASWWKVATIIECLLFRQNTAGKINHDQRRKNPGLKRQATLWVLLCSSVRWWFHRLFPRNLPVFRFYRGPKPIIFLFFLTFKGILIPSILLLYSLLSVTSLTRSQFSLVSPRLLLDYWKRG